MRTMLIVFGLLLATCTATAAGEATAAGKANVDKYLAYLQSLERLSKTLRPQESETLGGGSGSSGGGKVTGLNTNTDDPTPEIWPLQLAVRASALREREIARHLTGLLGGETSSIKGGTVGQSLPGSISPTSGDGPMSLELTLPSPKTASERLSPLITTKNNSPSTSSENRKQRVALRDFSRFRSNSLEKERETLVVDLKARIAAYEKVYGQTQRPREQRGSPVIQTGFQCATEHTACESNGNKLCLAAFAGCLIERFIFLWNVTGSENK